MQSKQQFALLMAEVYQKNEDIDYGAKSRRKRRASMDMSDQAEINSDIQSEEDSDAEREYMMEQFRKEEEIENE